MSDDKVTNLTTERALREGNSRKWSVKDMLQHAIDEHAGSYTKAVLVMSDEAGRIKDLRVNVTAGECTALLIQSVIVWTWNDYAKASGLLK